MKSEKRNQKSEKINSEIIKGRITYINLM